MINRKSFAAYVVPMVLFIGFLALVSLLKGRGTSLWFTAPEYWVYPLQTVVCGAVLVFFWRNYRLQRPVGLIFGLAIGLLVFLLWIAPQAWLGFSVRGEGFNPEVFSASPALYYLSIAFRFIRLAVVVPLVEEIFWRGFLLRYLIKEEFETVPLGSFSWVSFWVVVLAFTFSHSRPDWPAAFLTGILYNVVIYRTKSLSTCVLTHATTNLLLGIWIMQTRQWGFW